MIRESVRIALRALNASKLRSFLTMLGVIIGVASVVAVVAVGAGAQAQIAEQIRSLGSNVLLVYSTSSLTLSGRLLTEQDAGAIAEQVPRVQATSPYAWSNAQMVHGNKNASSVLWGTTADYFRIRDWPLAAGRYFAPEEEAAAGKYAIIGSELAGRIFQDEDPIGAEIRVQNVPAQVIGVLAPRGPMGAGRSQDDDIFMPITTVNRRVRGSLDEVRRDAVEYILVKVDSAEALNEAKVEIENLLKQRLGHTPDRPQSFRIGDPAAQMAVQQGATRTFALLLAAVASISLLVGGISIMNIMLVSVTERTREIGLRIALGARRRDVRNQFLLEAVSLCLAGGVLGIALGILAITLVAQLADWPVLVGVDAVIVALAFAVATGVFFGWYPAHKAARLQPVEALRSE
jgi:putative ABC transport system permease protein